MTATQTSPLALQARGVRRHFGDVRAVDGVDLEVPRGQIVALLGPNGAGKTTFLDMVLGLTTPDAGSLAVMGSSPKRAVHAGKVGAVLQSGGLLDDLTVRRTVAMVAACHGRTLGVDEVLERAGASDIADRKVSKCSGGEQQRLRFALALLTSPDLLLLDEPTAGMDVRARGEFWRTMRAEAQQGRTVVFATHYLQEAEDFAERIVLMRRGTVVADGSMEEIGGNRRKRLTCTWNTDAALSAQRIAQDAGADLVDAAPAGEGEGKGRVSFTAEDCDALALRLLADGLARDLEIHPARLDDVFLDLTADADTAETAAAPADTDTATTIEEGR